MEIKEAVEYAIEKYSDAIDYYDDLLDYLIKKDLFHGVCFFLIGVVDNKTRKEIRDLGFEVLKNNPNICEKYQSMQPMEYDWWFLVEPYECEIEEDMRIC